MFAEIIGTANSAQDGLEAIKRLQPDLLFFDIEMPRMNGFEMLEKIGNIDFEVIFVTAFDKYAIKAIRFCALDFLLKPVDINELTQAVEKATVKLKHKHENQQIKQLLQHITKPGVPKRIALTNSDEVPFVDVNQIIHCLGENNYTTVYISGGKNVLVSRTLKEFEELLTEYGFMRVHKAHLVNTRYIKAYIKKDGGYLELTDGSKVFISKSKKEELMHLLSNG